MTNKTQYIIEKNVPIPPLQIKDVINIVECLTAEVEQRRNVDDGWRRGYILAMDDVLQELG